MASKSAADSQTQYVYWKREKKNDTWKLARVEDIPSLIKEKGAMFTTWASFNKPPMEEETTDLLTYSVNRYGDLPLDFDSRGHVEKAKSDLIQVINILTTEYGVSLDDLQIFISGGKGFHLVIDRRLLGSEKGDNFLPLIYKSMVNDLFPVKGEVFASIDRSLYCMKRGKMFRLPNVRREENGRYKVPITFEELTTLDIDDLMELADAPRLDFPVSKSQVTPSVKLVTLFFQTSMAVRDIVTKRKKAPKRQPTMKSGEMLPCTKIILGMEHKAGDMSFNETCFSAIVPSLREVGIPHEVMLNVPEVETFLSNFADSEAYTTFDARYEHMRGVINRDKNSPAGFSCGSMRKCMGGDNSTCVKCPYLIKQFFFDTFKDETPSDEIDEATGLPSADTVLDENPVLDKLLHEFAWSHIGAKEVIIKIDDETTGEPLTLNRGAFESFVNNRPQIPRIAPDGKIKYDRPSDAWMRSPKRKTFLGGIKFCPTTNKKVADEDFFNTWSGFPMRNIDMDIEEAKEGCKLYRNHVEQTLCKGNKEWYTFIWAWLSDIIKNPGGKKPGSAIVLKGGKGTGKSTLVYPFKKILGPYFASMSNPRHAFANFNSHLENKLLVVLEEAVWGGSHEADSALKSMITETSMMIERKGFQAYSADTYMRVVMCSNEEWVVPASADERRFFIINTGLNDNDKSYFDRLYYEIDHGGAEALYVWLLKETFPEVNLYNPPKTEELNEQKLTSMNSVQEWWYGVLDDGHYVTGSSWKTIVDWSETVNPSELYTYYLGWCRMTGNRFSYKKKTFSNLLFSVTDGICPSPRTTRRGEDDKWTKVYKVGSLERARAIFCEKMGLSGDIVWTNVEI